MKKDSAAQNPLSHFDQAGNARMVDVGGKQDTRRVATACSEIMLTPEIYTMLTSGSIGKGDVLGVARIAGIMAAKKTPDLVPLAHPIMISKAEIDFVKHDETSSIEILATISTTGKTGVEMEALTSATVAALTIYDMCKAVDKAMTISNTRLLEKTGGKSGNYQAERK